MMSQPRFLSLALTALLSLVPAVGSWAADSFGRIQTESNFRAVAVGRSLWADQNHILLLENGRIAGEWGGTELKGAWEWRDGYLCRSLITPPTQTDCQLWMVNARANEFYVIRDHGKGSSFTYRVR